MADLLISNRTGMSRVVDHLEAKFTGRTIKMVIYMIIAICRCARIIIMHSLRSVAILNKVF